MPILVPRKLLEKPTKQDIGPEMGVYVRLQDINGRMATLPDVIHILVKYRRTDVIRWISWFFGMVEEEHGIDSDRQGAMTELLLPNELLNKLKEFIYRTQHQKWCVFHRRQLWFLLQLAIVTCKEDMPTAEEDQLRSAIAECCLYVNDIMEQAEPVSELEPGPSAANRWLTSWVIPTLTHRRRNEVLGRAWSFWFEIPKDPEIAQRFAARKVNNFETAFQEKYGLPLKDFFTLLYALYLGFSPPGDKDPSPFVMDEVAHLHKPYGEDFASKALSLISQTPENLAFKLIGNPRQSWTKDITLLREFPLLELTKGKHLCPDTDLLHGCMLEKIYFLLQRAYSDGDFNDIFGYIFECYVNRTIRRFGHEAGLLIRTFYASPEFQGGNDEAGDGILHWSRTAIVMEYKARLMTTRDKYSGVMANTLSGVDDIIGKKEGSNKKDPPRKGVYQLANVIKRIQKGDLIKGGTPQMLDLRDCLNIHPCLVTFEESVGLECVRQEAEAKLVAALEKDGVKRDNIKSLLILTIEELEILQKLALKHDPEKVIRDYVSYINANPKDRMGSFRGFIANTDYKFRPSKQPSMVEEAHIAARKALNDELVRIDAVNPGQLIRWPEKESGSQSSDA